MNESIMSCVSDKNMTQQFKFSQSMSQVPDARRTFLKRKLWMMPNKMDNAHRHESELRLKKPMPLPLPK